MTNEGSDIKDGLEERKDDDTSEEADTFDIVLVCTRVHFNNSPTAGDAAVNCTRVLSQIRLVQF